MKLTFEDVRNLQAILASKKENTIKDTKAYIKRLVKTGDAKPKKDLKEALSALTDRDYDTFMDLALDLTTYPDLYRAAETIIECDRLFDLLGAPDSDDE